MKRLLLILLVAAFSIPTFQSCKKGANDPAISFKSRDARLTATWKLTKIASTSTYYSGSNQIIRTLAYDGTTITETVTGYPTTTASGTYEMTIEKNGVMSWQETYASAGGSVDVQTSTGRWEWLNTDKNKTVVLLDGGYNIFEGGICVIDRLATKELVIRDEGNSNDNGDLETWDITYTFENTK